MILHFHTLYKDYILLGRLLIFTKAFRPQLQYQLKKECRAIIIDKIENAANYTAHIKGLAQALAFINKNYSLPNGEYNFEGDRLMSTNGMSLHFTEKKFEAHQAFADVMFVLEHSETVSYRASIDLTTCQAYDSSTDCALYNDDAPNIFIAVPKGYFYVMMPFEGHKPCIHINNATPYKKYIIKCEQ